MRSGRLRSVASFTPASLAGVAVAWALFLGGCQSNAPVSYETKPQPAASGAYPNPIAPGPMAPAPSTYGSLTGTTGSVEAPQPIPVTFQNPDGSARTAPSVTAKAAILVDGFGRVLFE